MASGGEEPPAPGDSQGASTGGSSPPAAAALSPGPGRTGADSPGGVHSRERRAADLSPRFRHTLPGSRGEGEMCQGCSRGTE